MGPTPSNVQQPLKGFPFDRGGASRRLGSMNPPWTIRARGDAQPSAGDSRQTAGRAPFETGETQESTDGNEDLTDLTLVKLVIFMRKKY